MRCFKLVCLSLTGVLLAAVAAGQELEKFRLKSGGDPVEARPVSWDFQNGQLTLMKADGTVMEVAAADLHASDMRLVERILKKQFLAGRKGQSITPDADPAGNSVDNRSGGDVGRLHGVRWFDNESDAQKVASGSDGSQDERPLVWFRVLGDMTGFM